MIRKISIDILSTAAIIGACVFLTGCNKDLEERIEGGVESGKIGNRHGSLRSDKKVDHDQSQQNRQHTLQLR